MNIFIICPVRNATPEQQAELTAYVAELEAESHIVWYPARDTNQQQTGYNICDSNRRGIEWADRVDVYFDSTSHGSFFDLGQAFALRKPIKIIRNEPLTTGKSFQNMINEWQQSDLHK